MKVVTPKQMALIESNAYRDGSLEADFMEEAGSGVALVAHDYAERESLDHHVILLCGKGNNAGDAYVAGIHLLHLDYDVMAFQIPEISTCSRLCQDNYHRFLEEGGRVHDLYTAGPPPFPPHGIIIDGIFGTGFKGSVEEPYASLIEAANASGLPIIAVDIPSGLNGDDGTVHGQAIVADETAFLGLPKMGFFLNDGWNHVGKLRYIDFGLPREYIEEAESELVMVHSEMVRPLLPPVVNSRHKYQAGYVVGLSGSPGMPGAALLSSISALRGGAGIVRLLYPEQMLAELAASPYELIKTPFTYDTPETVLEHFSKAGALFIGPGMGRTLEVQAFLKKIITEVRKPCVIDADALYWLAQEEFPLPQSAILTPHMGEMQRLLGDEGHRKVDRDFLTRCQEYAENKRVTLILKGGPTFIFQADEPISVSPAGNPGMATAGSGDVLTGLLAALLAQGCSPYDAARLGVYIHGLAGEHAAQELTPYCMAASDIMFYFPEGFRLIEL